MATEYRTSELVKKDRFKFWRQLMCQNFVPARGMAEDISRFDARFMVNRLGPATLFRMSAPQQRWERSGHHLRQAPHDEFLLTLMLSGSGRLEQDGREVVQGPGVISLYDTSHSYRYEIAGDTMAVKIPRRELLSRIRAPLKVAMPMSVHSPVGAMLSGLVSQAAYFDGGTGTTRGSLIGSSILDMVAALVDQGEVAEQGCADSDETTDLEQVRRYIRGHLQDAGLSVGAIAAAQGMSPRTLNRLFKRFGTTPMRWVWRERLQAAHRLLQQVPRQRVTDVAFACGFSELSHFSRAFKTEFGYCPQGVHAQSTSTSI